eukprot:CAMPEP_0197423996 /NCGR_PEP_ID=MMETSP1170-20131217/24086_1 /TAXON_ID=54406 /ORGANISM="Sarcinochrysis sp, Strain CCMP770" /LENGTH=85 /DNA_ID=CAMNT_0042951457 /DNA_START=73 /DNA_END=327 /DNA_ORIENTATION=-
MAGAPDNVYAYLQREAQLSEAKDHVYRTEFMARNAEFMEKGVAKVATAARLRQQRAAEAEMLNLDAELVKTRRERLKHFYDLEYQ